MLLKRMKANALLRMRTVVLCGLMIVSVSGCSTSDTPLTGTSWRLESYGAIASPTQVMDAPAITLSFGPGGVLTGFSGCNIVEGEYGTDGDVITITYHTGPGLHCDGSAIVEQERMFLSILADINSFALAGETLTLTSDDRTLVFARA